MLLRLTEMKPSQAWGPWALILPVAGLRGPRGCLKKPDLTGEDACKINTKWGLRAWETWLCVAVCEQKGCGVLLRCPADCHPNTSSPQLWEEHVCSSKQGSHFPKGPSLPSPLLAPFKAEPGSSLLGWASTANSVSFVWAPLPTQGCCPWLVFPVSSSGQGAAFSLSQLLWKLFEKGLQCLFIFHMPASLILYLTSHLGIAHSAVHV